LKTLSKTLRGAILKSLIHKSGGYFFGRESVNIGLIA